MKINQLVIIGVLAAVSGLSGCAVIPESANLKYEPQAGVTKVADHIAVNVITTDTRASKLIGHVKNGFGMEMAGISSDEPVDKTVGDAIKTELVARGFDLSNSRENTVVTANVKKFYNNYVTHFTHADVVADVTIFVTVSNKNGVMIYQHEFTEENTDVSHLLLTAGNAKESLDKALAKTMADLFNDKAFIAALLTGAPKPASN